MLIVRQLMLAVLLVWMLIFLAVYLCVQDPVRVVRGRCLACIWDSSRAWRRRGVQVNVPRVGVRSSGGKLMMMMIGTRAPRRDDAKQETPDALQLQER